MWFESWPEIGAFDQRAVAWPSGQVSHGCPPFCRSAQHGLPGALIISAATLSVIGVVAAMVDAREPPSKRVKVETEGFSCQEIKWRTLEAASAAELADELNQGGSAEFPLEYYHQVRAG